MYEPVTVTSEVKKLILRAMSLYKFMIDTVNEKRAGTDEWRSWLGMRDESMHTLIALCIWCGLDPKKVIKCIENGELGKVRKVGPIGFSAMFEKTENEEAA